MASTATERERSYNNHQQSGNFMQNVNDLASSLSPLFLRRIGHCGKKEDDGSSKICMYG